MWSHDMATAAPTLFSSNRDIFVCPACQGDVKIAESRFRCSTCQIEYPEDRQIPLLFWPHEGTHSTASVTEQIKSFYEQNPFPDYEDFDSRWSLREKAQEVIFARLLDEQIPHGALVLEVGCGTGQLSNFLGLSAGRAVFGADLCLNSLRLGADFKKRNQIENVAFLQMNLFKPVFRPESFDLVICNGVLLVTSAPFAGFRSIARLVKKSGFILIGLYNTHGRLLTDLRRVIFKASGTRLHFLDPHLRNRNIGPAKKHAWFMDQYKNPHETKQTIGEVLGWFDRSGFEFVSSIPSCQPGQRLSPTEKLFECKPRGTKLDRFLVQARMMLSGGREGGFFVMIGRKKASPSAAFIGAESTAAEAGAARTQTPGGRA